MTTGGSGQPGDDRPRPPDEAAPSDPLADVLELAKQEGALEGEARAAFLDALREQARLVLAERVGRLEDRLRSLEKEATSASEAHVALLAHHRSLVDQVAAELVSVAALSPFRARQARRRLLALASQLRHDSR